VEADSVQLQALKAKTGVLQRFGYRWLDGDKPGEFTTLDLGLKMPPTTFSNGFAAVQACWDHFTAANEIWLRTDDGSMFRKLHDGRSGETSAPVVVLEHIWPLERGIFVFEDTSAFQRLADLENAEDGRDAG
jgi:hypothetical protein